MAEETSTADRRAAGAAESGETRRAARSAAGRQARETRPEQVVVTDPPPEPDYPRYRVEPGAGIRLADVDPDESEHFGRKKDAAPELSHHRDRIADLQARLYAENRRSLLLVLQAMDTGGKDGTIKHVFRGVNPQGCEVSSFKAPSAEESAHDFLWRYHRRVPSRGMIGIFNRSHYEDVLVVRVKGLVPEEVWRPRYEVINQFEQALSLSGVTVLKFYLHISREEQKRRLESRLADPDKRWKFSANDLRERRYWSDYMTAFEEAIGNTSTDVAPWYVVPADNKWYRNLVIARTIADTLEAMDPRYPAPEEGLEQVTVDD
jgi:PPK2 family polyphosphate:nucleotide phosphotransferase